MKYPLAEQSLLLVQCTGVTYTRDCLSHAVGLEVSRACPLCGQDDSRLHRAKFCEVVADLRGPLLSFLGDRELPAHTWAYGLWDEPASLRDWQADACALEWPFLVESPAVGRQFVFTDGSCLSPRSPVLSISGGSVILAKTRGSTRWFGLDWCPDWSSPVIGLSFWLSPLRWPPFRVSPFSVTIFRSLRMPQNS